VSDRWPEPKRSITQTSQAHISTNQAASNTNFRRNVVNNNIFKLYRFGVDILIITSARRPRKNTSFKRVGAFDPLQLKTYSGDPQIFLRKFISNIIMDIFSEFDQILGAFMGLAKLRKLVPSLKIGHFSHLPPYLPYEIDLGRFTSGCVAPGCTWWY
jgi:hypothetical protein